jgi:hypothetical protein
VWRRRDIHLVVQGLRFKRMKGAGPRRSPERWLEFSSGTQVESRISGRPYDRNVERRDTQRKAADGATVDPLPGGAAGVRAAQFEMMRFREVWTCGSLSDVLAAKDWVPSEHKRDRSHSALKRSALTTATRASLKPSRIATRTSSGGQILDLLDQHPRPSSTCRG